MTISRPVPHNLLSGYVVELIREEIRTGRLRPGDRLIEADLAERFETSKTPVREGIRDLERQGLVEMRPRRGACIRSMSVKDVREIKELRAALEGLSARLALANYDEQWIAELDQLTEQMKLTSDPAEMNDLHANFHALLVSRSDNARLRQFIHSLDAQVRTFLSFIHLLFEDPVAMADNHAILVDALRTRDPAAVQRAIDEHILEDGGRLEQIWESSNQGHG